MIDLTTWDTASHGDLAAVLDPETGRYVSGTVSTVDLDRETYDVRGFEVLVRDAGGRRFVQVTQTSQVESLGEGRYTTDRRSDWANRHLLQLSV